MTTDKSPVVLLPCPFCNGNDVGNYEHPGEDDVIRHVVCNTCGASCCDLDTLPEKNAYETWNTRVKVPSLEDKDKEIAQLRSALSGDNGCLARMNKARGWLTNDNPRTECNWGILDTTDILAIIEKN